MYGVVREMRKLQNHWSAVVMAVHSIRISKRQSVSEYFHGFLFEDVGARFFTNWEDLRAVYPSDSLPSSTVDETVKVDADCFGLAVGRVESYSWWKHTHGQVPPSVAINVARSRISRRVGLHYVSSDIPHGKRSDKGTPDETVASAHLFNQPHGKDDHAEGLGDAVEARSKELGSGAVDAKSLKDAGRVCRIKN